MAGWIEGHTSADMIQRGLLRVEELIGSLSEQEPAELQRSTLNLMFRSITLSQTAIRLEVRAGELVDKLVGGDTAATGHSAGIAFNPGRHDLITNNGRMSVAGDHDGTIMIELPVALRRRGNGMRIVIDSPTPSPNPIPRSLI